MADDSLVLKAFISGGVCGIVSTFLNPMDVTKIRMQNQVKQVYTGLFQGAFKILREEGLINGWGKGVTASICRELTYSSIRMGAYEPIRRFLSSQGEEKSSPAHPHPAIKFSSALISGGIGAAVANPFDLVKTRFQAVMPGQSAPYPSTASALLTVFKLEGLPGLYKGWIVTTTRAAVLTSAQLGSYDSIKNNLLMGVFGMENGYPLHLCAAMSAGIITTTAANPVDVIKTRYLSDMRGQYSGPIQCAAGIFQEQGLRGFFKGWVPSYWRLGPHTVLSFMLIENIRSRLGIAPM